VEWMHTRILLYTGILEAYEWAPGEMIAWSVRWGGTQCIIDRFILYCLTSILRFFSLL
jgi:hypothetical protein